MDGNGNRVKPSQPGNVICLRCDKLFDSPDRCSVRICPHCKKDPERFGLIGDNVSHISGGDAGNFGGYRDVSSESELPDKPDRDQQSA